MPKQTSIEDFTEDKIDCTYVEQKEDRQPWEDDYLQVRRMQGGDEYHVVYRYQGQEHEDLVSKSRLFKSLAQLQLLGLEPEFLD